MTDSASGTQFGIQLGEISSILEQETARAKATNEAAAAAHRGNQAALAQVRESANAYQEVGRRTQAEFEAIRKDREATDAMLNSDNPLDAISLIGAQILRPQAHTSAGRKKRAAEASQMLALQGQIHGANTTAAQAAIAMNNARAASVAARQEAGLNNLRTRVQVLNLAAQQNAAAETLKAQALESQSLMDLQDSIANATPDGLVKIGDHTYEKWQVQEREKALHTRSLLAKIPAAEAPEFQQLMLDTMTHSELLELQGLGYAKDGLTFQPGLVDAAIGTAAAREAQVASDQMTAMTIDDALAQDYTTADGLINRLDGKFDPLSPMGSALESYRTIANKAAALGEVNDTTEGKVLQSQMLNQGRAALMAAAEKEAKIQAKGDTSLQGILRNRILGLDTDPQQVYDYAADKFQKGQSFLMGLNPKAANTLQVAATRRFQELVAEQGTDQFGNSDLDSDEKKILKQQAFQEGWQIMLESGALEVNKHSSVAGINWEGNPFKAEGFGQQDIIEVERQAKNNAITSIATKLEVEPSAVEAALQGRHRDVEMTDAVANEIRKMYNSQVVVAEYQAMEGLRQGLGNRYTEWLAANAEALSVQLNQQLHGNDSDVYRQEVVDMSRDVVSLWRQADHFGDVHAMELANERLVEMRGPTVLWQSVLSTTNNIPDSLKYQVWSQIIEPTINEGKKQGWSNKDITDRITNRLAYGVEGMNDMNSAAKTILKALPEIESILDTHFTAVNLNTSLRYGARDQKAHYDEILKKQVPGNLGWLRGGLNQ